jgi:hypothetical protein
MNAGIRRPVLVVGILLVAAGYAATKEWEWQSDVDTLPLVRVAQEEGADPGMPRVAIWQTGAVTVQPEQIFQD